MQRRRLFLVLAVALAAAWTIWLGYQALTTADPIVVSQPQILVASVVVQVELADANENPRPARVIKVYRGHATLGLKAEDHVPQGLQVMVRDLRGIKAGSYILALRDAGPKGEFEVVPTPRSPGYLSGAGRDEPPIYPVTDSTQLQVIEALRHAPREVPQR